MNLKISQDFEYEGENYWKWWIWIEGLVPELDQVHFVVYTLHPTFPNPVRKISDRSSKFRLTTAGWGVCQIYANVVLKDKREIRLEHFLKLSYPDGRITTA